MDNAYDPIDGTVAIASDTDLLPETFITNQSPLYVYFHTCPHCSGEVRGTSYAVMESNAGACPHCNTFTEVEYYAENGERMTAPNPNP